MALKDYLKQDFIVKEFARVIENPTNFLLSAITVIQNNKDLQNADKNSILYGLMNAAIIGLPINPNFNLAYIIPYKNNKEGKVYAQFQIGAQGYVTLAIASGFVENFGVSEIYEGELIVYNPLKGSIFDFNNRKSDKVIGFACYVRLKTGLERYEYWTYEQVMKHAKTYSESYKHNYGTWVTNPIAMGKKTVAKHTVKRYIPLNATLERAIETDSAVIVGENEFIYMDNDTEEVVHVVSSKETKKESTQKEEKITEQKKDDNIEIEQKNVTPDSTQINENNIEIPF